jgi:hypothetical protein
LPVPADTALGNHIAGEGRSCHRIPDDDQPVVLVESLGEVPLALQSRGRR